MQMVMVMCLLVSALLAASCATLHRSMSAGVGIVIGTEAAAEEGESTETAGLNSGALRCNIERSVL